MEQNSKYRRWDKPIYVAVGETFSVVLDSNPSTGYCWQLVEMGKKGVVHLISSEYLPSPSRLKGSAGKEIWTFRAVGPGKIKIPLHYARPWEKDHPPLKQETVIVISRKV